MTFLLFAKSYLECVGGDGGVCFCAALGTCVYFFTCTSVLSITSHVSSVEACSVHVYVCMNMYIHICIVLMGSHSAQILEKIHRPLYPNPFLHQNHAKPYRPLEKHQSLGSLDQESPVPSTVPAVSSEWSRQFRPI